jgi:signal transduction histidine kinase
MNDLIYNEMKRITTEKSPINYQMNRLQNYDQLVEEQQVLEMKHVLVSSKLDHLNTRIQKLNHDLRSPLGGITGLLDLLINEDKEQIEVQTCDLIIIRESAQSLLNLINGALVVMDTQNGEKESMNIDRKLSSVIIEINRLYLPLAKHKGISLSLNSKINNDIQLPYSAFINLIQITGNLIANAVKYTPSNGSINVDFTLSAKEDLYTLNMNVTDTGKSMSPDQVSAFNQGKPVSRSLGTNGEQGFGIGLQHVHQMVSEGNGHIYMKSAKESGTFFSLSLPLPDKNMICDNGSHSVGLF